MECLACYINLPILQSQRRAPPIVRASTPRGAMVRLGRAAGMAWHIVGDYGDMVRYDSKSGATCAFVQEWENDAHCVLSRVNFDLEV